jgi:hypothetical protein
MQVLEIREQSVKFQEFKQGVYVLFNFGLIVVHERLVEVLVQNVVHYCRSKRLTILVPF